MRYTNVMLTIIAALLAIIAIMIFDYRPVTWQDLRKAGDQDARRQHIQRIPLVNINDGQVEVTNEVQVEVANPTISVTIER